MCDIQAQILKGGNNVQENRSIFDKINDLTMKVAEPMANFAAIPWVASLQEGMIGIMPVVIIGSLFLVLSALGLPWISTGAAEATPLLPFLSPYADKLLVFFNLTMNFLGLYAAITIAMAYGKKLDIPERSTALLGLVTFLLMTVNSTSLTGTVKDAAGVDVAFSVGGISIGSFGASGLFTAILVGLLSVRLYKLVIDSGIVIKMPEGVPPAIAASFTSLIPYAVVFMTAWIIRTLLGFDFATWLTTLIAPLFNAADNVFVYTVTQFLQNLFWAAGIHGDNMLSPITSPFTTMTIAANAEAMSAGLALPYVWTQQLSRMHGWTITVWPLFIFMFFSKVPGHKTLFWTALPAGIFTIIEPVMFGLPLALNPILLIPFLLSTVVGAAFTYIVAALGLVSKFFAALPWATPPFILGPAASGDWKWIIIIAINVALGYFIYLPFWRMYEKAQLAKIEANKEEIKEA